MGKLTILSLVLLSLAGISPVEESKTIIRPAVGDIAPEIALPSVDGEILKLSSLRGKVVFVDFWASWCRTCRIENKNVRRAYSTYQNKSFKRGEGFEVFSISLDEDKEIWKKAIANDRLEWSSHVSDFKKWKSPVVESYNFRYLPHNVLIDGEGKIIAKGLFGEKLEELLASLLSE